MLKKGCPSIFVGVVYGLQCEWLHYWLVDALLGLRVLACSLEMSLPSKELWHFWSYYQQEAEALAPGQWCGLHWEKH